MSLLRFKIQASGSYLPARAVSAKEMEQYLAVDERWILKKTGVENRYFSDDENQAVMAAKAINKALETSPIPLEEIDLLISASGTPDQPIPHNSALIHKELNLPASITPLDVNATCLSFVQALKVAASLLETKTYKNIIIVSSERPSVGLNYDSPESAALLGDGAVAFIISQSEDEQGAMFTEFETYSEFVHATEIAAGGTRLHPNKMDSNESKKYLFDMNGTKVFKVTSKLFPGFYSKNMSKHDVHISDFKYIIPHQASMMGLRLMQKKLEFPEEKFYINLQKYGNLVAGSIPMALHELIESKSLKENDKVLLLATAAGLTFGMMGIQL